MAFAATASKRGAFADMNTAAIDVAQALARLSELTIFELRGEWRRLHRMPPPMRLSRDLLIRGITLPWESFEHLGRSRRLRQHRAFLVSDSSQSRRPRSARRGS